MFLSLFAKPLPAGSPAPPFILPDQEGNVFVLNLQRGKNVVLVFYPGDDTAICTRQLCEIRDRYEEIVQRGGKVVGINPQSPESHIRFRKNHQFPFPLLVDYEKRVANLYRCGGLIVRRTVYVVNREGTIVYARRGKPPVEEILAAMS